MVYHHFLDKMATASTTHKKSKHTSGVISCGNCLEVIGYLINPVKLQCGHIFCETCLQDHHKNLPDITCFTCKEKTSNKIEDLPSAMGDKAAFCDSCSKRGISKMSATVYCSQCNMKFCAKHQQFHGECMPDHDVLSVVSEALSNLRNQRFCSTHTDQALILGCNRCWKICCAKCTTSLDPCTNVSGDHKLIAIEDLAGLAKSKLEPYKKLAEDRFEEISAIVKDTTIQISQWDVDTDANVRIIHMARDEQIDEIREKYLNLEREYVNSRAESKQKMTEFIETDAGVKLSEFNDQLKNMRECVSHKHPVDLVLEKEEICSKIDELSKTDVPRLIINDNVEVFKKDTAYRELEVALSSNRGIPTSLALKQCIPVGDYCNAICHYKGYTYVAKNDGTVARIDAEGRCEISYISGLSNVTNIRAYNDHLYMIYYDGPQQVVIYHVNGQRVRTWTHSMSHAPRGNKICILQEHLILINPGNQSLDIYSLDGKLEKRVGCPQLPSSGYYSVAQVGQDSLIVASATGVIFTLRHQTGQVTWTSRHKFKDTAVVALNDDTVLLSGANYYAGSSEILVKILNIETGIKL